MFNTVCQVVMQQRILSKYQVTRSQIPLPSDVQDASEAHSSTPIEGTRPLHELPSKSSYLLSREYQPTRVMATVITAIQNNVQTLVWTLSLKMMVTPLNGASVDSQRVQKQAEDICDCVS